MSICKNSQVKSQSLCKLVTAKFQEKKYPMHATHAGILAESDKILRVEQSQVKRNFGGLLWPSLSTEICLLYKGPDCMAIKIRLWFSAAQLHRHPTRLQPPLQCSDALELQIQMQAMLFLLPVLPQASRHFGEEASLWVHVVRFESFGLIQTFESEPHAMCWDDLVNLIAAGQRW